MLLFGRPEYFGYGNASQTHDVVHDAAARSYLLSCLAAALAVLGADVTFATARAHVPPLFCGLAPLALGARGGVGAANGGVAAAVADAAGASFDAVVSDYIGAFTLDAAAVKLAAARRAPAEPKQELLRLIDAGFAIASGTDTWEGG
jgi:hypothetical protein